MDETEDGRQCHGHHCSHAQKPLSAQVEFPSGLLRHDADNALLDAGAGYAASPIVIVTNSSRPGDFS